MTIGVRTPPTYALTTVDVGGNYFKLVPKHMYSLSAMYTNGNFKVRINSKSKGKFYTNDTNANSYKGYKFITDLMASYKFNKQNQLSLSIYNLFDKEYISQVEGSSYDAGAPRSAMLTYTYKF